VGRLQGPNQKNLIETRYENNVQRFRQREVYEGRACFGTVNSDSSVLKGRNTGIVRYRADYSHTLHGTLMELSTGAIANLSLTSNAGDLWAPQSGS
jgi:hypothetical protein